ncbi:M23 family metallopeptidase [Microbacterium trichothecenolyticum]|uniref:Murein DD-endopeptidase MepM/ murein hydrolase activator NlpD n=1 Tax=Microbacterium trichothecenolyticum TaxID=69370 RepID=A0ABU0U064_MICTR|nr:M23 family metallopeptidase [Microbacterium trichothecenolyticum]MDQ1124607.1 murein DD-endopeptidase MepM/ murein hydrolase activator NlpD [Microbacterium trichothecenolyticum]
MPSESPSTEPAYIRRSRRPVALPATEAASSTPVPQLTRAEMRRRAQADAAVMAMDADAPAAAIPSEPAPVDADVAAQSEILESVAAAVIETVIAATIEPTLPEGPTVAAAESDALEVTVVDERRNDDADVAVILQSADADVATTPVTLPTSPITLPVSRRARRRPQADVIIDTASVDAPVVAEPLSLAPAETVSVDARPSSASPRDDSADEFESAARLFAFTGENAVQSPASVAPAPQPVAEGLPPVAAAPRTRRNVRRIATASFSVGVMGVVGLLTVGMTMPVSALASVNGTDSVASTDTVTTRLAVTGGDVAPGDGAVQAYVAPAQAQAAVVDRADGYSATTYAKMAADSGISNPSNFYVNDPTAPIQWPFAVGVPITYGFGMRDGNMHEGADFVPGEGAPVQAIADGVVRIATEQGGAFGVTVLIDHQIDGQLVSSRYGHMQYGSLQVTPGEHVKVGQFLGRTGNTGRSFGAHTHVEILQNGTTPIDPIVWLRQHAGG